MQGAEAEGGKLPKSALKQKTGKFTSFITLLLCLPAESSNLPELKQSLSE